MASKSFAGHDMGIEHAWATDADEFACGTYRNYFFPRNPERVVCSKIEQEGLFEDLKNMSEVQGLAFGFPCNDFSSVGERKGTNGDFGPLYSYCVKGLNVFDPDWFFAENVRGLHQSIHANDFDKILSELSTAGKGYDLFPHLYRFEEYGVPQARHRIIIIGIRSDHGLIFKIPSPEPFKNVDVRCSTAISRPFPEDVKNNERTIQSPRVVERLANTNPGENAFTAKLPEHVQLHIKGATLSQIYKKLDPEKPAYTVTGSGGGGTHVYHWSENRALTNRERARLQTFPDDFVFEGTKERVRRQIGMAVPPEGAKVIFEALLNTFAGKEYESIPQNIDFPDRQRTLVLNGR